MKYILISLFPLLTFCSYSQSPCNGPKWLFYPSSEPDTIYHFASGKTIGLCGFKQVDSLTKQSSFSEFFLFVCGEDSIIAGGGGFLQNSKLRMLEDTLIVEDCQFLPIDDNFGDKETPWTIDKIYFADGRVQVEHSINRSFRKYGPSEIRIVLNEYQKSGSGRRDISENTLELAYKLFIAAISGSEEARKYFNDFPQKYELGVLSSEIYDDIKDKLLQWDKK